MERVRDQMKSLMLNDVEMGKKDDDFPKHKSSRARGPGWRPSRVAPTRRGAKRFLILLLIACAIYLFYGNMPESQWRDRRRPKYSDQSFSPGQGQAGGWNYIPPRNKGERDRARANAAASGGQEGGHRAEPARGVDPYEGPVEHPNLAATLHAASRPGAGGTNNHALFTASSLKSVANILPMACQMGKELRNEVHFALMSHSEVELVELQKLNGIDGHCHILFHDARIDHPTSSTEQRLKLGVQDALLTIHASIRPRVIITDDSATEESYFLEGLHWQASELGVGVIELPRDSGNSVGWLAKLDIFSLSVWNRVHVDILVSASSGTTGSLMRLLKSLASADYSGVPMPRLTVELPPEVDTVAEDFISKFSWPPKRYSSTHTPSQLTLRKRTTPLGMDEEEANIRFIESFYPSSTAFDYVLVLSPQVEVERQFFHYLMYTVFQYRHSLTAVLQAWDKRLFGIALDIPGTKLDGTAVFEAPKSNVPRSRGEETSFLWQAPVSHAMLFVGEKWAELHGLVEQSLAVHRGASQNIPRLLEKKEISTNRPGWMEYALRLNMLRGYWMLYPSPTSSRALVTIHSERALSPEEYATASSDAEAEEAGHGRVSEPEDERKSQAPLTVTLPGAELLLPFDDMPVLSWDGDVVDADELDKRAMDYRTEWRTEVGGCGEATTGVERTEPQRDGFARDLFCPAGLVRGKDAVQ